MRRIALCVVAWLLSSVTSALAQGVQTGTIRGVVKDAQDLPVPGVTVSVTSPALQGVRTTITDAQGMYTLALLPAGLYTARYEIQGFSTGAKVVELLLGQIGEQNVSLRPAGVAESVTVAADLPAPIASPVIGANFKHEEVEALPLPRNLEGIAQLAPNLTENAPNASGGGGQVVINGAFAFDNVFMINGVDVNDNLFGSPQNLFIEDAIQETQVLTSGISAEYGRFTGGVVNAITKSGGNTFSGSARLNLTSPSWVTATPFEVGKPTQTSAHQDTIFRTWEGTFGGPIVKDKLWFFTAGRYRSLSNPVTLNQTGLVATQDDVNKRGEIKITGSPNSNHTITGGYLNDPRTVTNASGIQTFVIDPHSESDANYPNWYYYTNYHGVFGTKFLLEAQYSQRHSQLGQTGPSGSNLVTDSPILSATQCVCLYNAPYFDANDPEDRNNRQLTASGTTYWNGAGSHQTRVGYEWYRSQRTGGNSQSPTNYVFNADFVTDAAGKPALDSTGRPTPIFEPGVSLIQFFPAIRGAVINIDTNSAFAQDHWAISRNWSTDLGARFEHLSTDSTGSITGMTYSRISPRLAVSYDITGDGNHIVHATYAQYSGSSNPNFAGANSPVGNPPEVDSLYRGPAGQGYGFAPGFAPSSYPINSANSSVLDPTQNIFIAPGTKSPLTHEFTLSYGTSALKGRGYFEASYVARATRDLIDDSITLQGGVTNVVVNGVSAGRFTNVIIGNNDLARRDYQGLVFQSRYRITNPWTVNGSWTIQLKNDGNYEGENTNQPAKSSLIGDYPEAITATRNFPDGRLQDFQRHRIRLWTIYNWNMSRAGAISLAGMLRVDSARVYSLGATNQLLTTIQAARLAAAGYPDAPATQTIYFGDRGSQEYAGFGVFDMSVNYDVPVFRTLRPWLKVDLFNAFNNQKVIAWNTTVRPNPAAGVDSLGIATGYTPGSTFGTATGNTVSNLSLAGIPAFPVAFNGAQAGGRTFRIAVGFRF
jgi:hypothetical protein